MKQPTILVTRPEPGASKTAEALIAKGLNAVKLPFTEMVAKTENTVAIRLQELAGVVVTSANALRYANPTMLDKIRTLPLFAVGDATADFAQELKFENVYSADGNAEDLCALVSAKVPAYAHLVYLCGVTRTDDVERELHSKAFALTTIETYETKKVSQLTYKLTEVLGTQKVDALLFYSSMSAQIFSQGLKEIDASQLSDIKVIFCISDKAKRALPDRFMDICVVSSAPRDDQMIREVQKYYSAQA